MKKRRLNFTPILFIYLILHSMAFSSTVTTWQVVLNKSVVNDAAMKIVIEDLQITGKKFGLNFEVITDQQKISGNAIFVGQPSTNRATAKLIQREKIQLQNLTDSQGYEIVTLQKKDVRSVIVAGGSVSGDVYGLYWIWDRLRVFKEIPDLNVTRIPVLKIRFTSGSTREAMQNALRLSANWVTGSKSVNHLFPWQIEPESSENKKNRAQTQTLLDYAHALHLKYLVVEDEVSFHPTLLKEFGAKPTPADPAFWDAVQAKYRRLFQIMPEIDGVQIRTGESTRIGGNFVSLDVMHKGEGCDWSLAKRYRTYVKKMYNVVVGEFNKIYFHRTWVTSAFEQHSQADVYKQIFTDDIPVKNLYLSPYLSQTDRYFHQPYNPTFNQTPHNMVVLLSMLDYHANSDSAIFPSFPGQYHQAGLQTILAPKSSNVKGVHFGSTTSGKWSTRDVTAYVVFRLAWNPDEDVKTIARDFAAIHFGKAAAEKMAEIFLLSPAAYKYGVYIEPVAYGNFCSLPHLRLNTFPAKGYHRIDHGKQHLAFLRTLYLRCKPWQTETLAYLDHGLDLARQMTDLFQSARPLIVDPGQARKAGNTLALTQGLIQVNNLYVKTFFAYFQYRENPTGHHKNKLSQTAVKLQQSMEHFLLLPNCDYRLDGMEQLLRNVHAATADLTLAEKLLKNAPEPDSVKSLIHRQQKKWNTIFNNNRQDAIKILSWQGRVDGRDLIKIKSKTLEVEHLRYDPINSMSYRFSNALPAQPVTVVPVDIQSRSFHPFVLEQPSEKNDFTVTIYLSDYPCHGYSWWKFELYYFPQSPVDLGVENPWEDGQ